MKLVFDTEDLDENNLGELILLSLNPFERYMGYNKILAPVSYSGSGLDVEDMKMLEILRGDDMEDLEYLHYTILKNGIEILSEIDGDVSIVLKLPDGTYLANHDTKKKYWVRVEK